ncbi:MAG TPA: MraY family glycosyltransferase [Candidatus Sulfotelmatobacter sp.]|nr:MraY family glycosyltransferase [Candidatus Sulfotelmatobacter sp.]
MIQADPGALLVIGGAFGSALLLALLLTPLAARAASAVGAIDAPDAARRVHLHPLPRGGGVAVAAAFVIVGATCFAFVAGAGSTFDMGDITPPEALALFGGAAVAAGLGFLDDRFQLRARWQLLMQVGLAIGAVAAGVIVDFINNPAGPRVITFSTPFAVGFTVFWIAGMINSINWIDGLDGLSTGVALIAAVTLGLISLGAAIDQPAVTLLCACLAGALAGFLPWNFHPARVFIGSAGTYFIGYTLAVLSILGTAKVAVALLVLGVPIIDTFWIIVRRTLAGQAPFTADRGHLHHRLLDLGVSHRGAVLTIYAFTGILAVLSLVLSGSGQLYAFLGLVVGAGVLLYVSVRRGGAAVEADAYEGGGGGGAPPKR